MEIVTYNPKNPQKQPHSFFVLNKGLHSGRPMMRSCPNCFMVTARDTDEMRRLFNYVYIIWRSDKFNPYLVGSVIPFLRIGDFKSVLQSTMNNPDLNHGKIRFVFSLLVAMRRRQQVLDAQIRNLRQQENICIRDFVRLS